MSYLSRRLRDERRWDRGQLEIRVRVDTSDFERALDRSLRTFDLRTLDRIHSSGWGRGA